jgi:uncharacterized protein YutE (UPF0331/DUF86 family)
MLKEVEYMYFVDREKIETTLVYLETQTRLFSQVKEWSTALEKAALERVTQMMLESVLDVGNAMIDGFIMRDPGSYEDIIDILMDEKVISTDTGSSLKVLIGFRKKLVQFYTEIDHAELVLEFSKRLPALDLFTANVRDYLTNELGPVSAFKN